MRLMIVDDDPVFRRSLQYLLEAVGLDVATFEDGAEALAAFRASPDRFDGILTDLAMPHLRGNELARAVWETHPGFPVTVLSGCPDSTAISEVEIRGGGCVLGKPAELDQILAAFRSLGLRLPDPSPNEAAA